MHLATNSKLPIVQFSSQPQQKIRHQVTYFFSSASNDPKVTESELSVKMSGSSDYGGNNMKYHAFIASRTKRVEVDNRLSIRLYYRMASNLLKQASIYREEDNVVDLYILLLRFSSLVTDTIPNHRDYQQQSALRIEYRKRLMQIMNEVESLKPEVQRRIEQMSASSSQDSTCLPGPAQPTFTRSSHSYYSGTSQKDYTQVGSSGRRDYLNRPSNTESPVFNPSYLDDYTSNTSVQMSLPIPRPKDETLSRHSILGSSSQPIRRLPVPIRPVMGYHPVQYPNYINASPIDLPSLQESWGTNPQPPRLSYPEYLDSAPMAKSDTNQFFADPHFFNLPRQPLPPPVYAPVQMQPFSVGGHGYSNNQPQAPEVTQFRPGLQPPQVTQFPETKGPKRLHITPNLLDEFMRLAAQNTQRNLETCGVLAGYLKNGVFDITTLIIPKQESTSDSCQTLNEEEIFDIQDKRGLFQLGWIHTHPKQTCFMSSVDLHTHYSYQVMLPEAIAIVMAPTDTSQKYGIFRLSDPGGVRVLQNCQRRGFHPHEEPPEGGPIYEHSSNVWMNPKLNFDVVDCR